jgi:hypothetical protein
MVDWDLHGDDLDETMERDLVHDQHLERARMLARQAAQADAARRCREWLERQEPRP